MSAINGCAKLSYSLGIANFDRRLFQTEGQAIPDRGGRLFQTEGAAWLKERLAVSVLTAGLKMRS